MMCSCFCRKCLGRKQLPYKTILRHANAHGQVNIDAPIETTGRLSNQREPAQVLLDLFGPDDTAFQYDPLHADDSIDQHFQFEVAVPLETENLGIDGFFNLEQSLCSDDEGEIESDLRKELDMLNFRNDDSDRLQIDSIDLIEDENTLSQQHDDAVSSLATTDNDCYSSDDDQKNNDFMLQMRCFATHARVSRVHMNELLRILRDQGFEWLPLDYRSVLNKCSDFDRLTQLAPPIGSSTSADVTLVCGYCFLASFDEPDLRGAVTCHRCDVTVLRCPRPMCYTNCVMTGELGARSMSSLQKCMSCMVHSESPVARRTFRFNISTYLKNAFADVKQATNFMAPFLSYYSLENHSTMPHATVRCAPDWYKHWADNIAQKSFSGEIWDGKLFRNHVIWKNRGLRSLVLIISLDWFPAFKQRDYSVGVLTVTPANLTSAERAYRQNCWVLAVIEGPNEPKHVFDCLRPCFEELSAIEQRGINVFDSLTRTFQTIYVSASLVSADTPACARLGNHVGHGAYQSCISCNYMACVCGCKPNAQKQQTEIPARWNNRDYRSGGSSRQLVAGIERPMNKGEHIVFLDTEVLLPHHLRDESEHRQGLAEITDALDRITNQAEIDRIRQRTRCNGPSALSLLPNFSFTQGFSLEAMHAFIKGTFDRLWMLTVGDSFKTQWFNVQYYSKGLSLLKARLISFKFPTGMASANKYVSRRHSLKADELYTILRVCGHFVFNNIIPNSCVYVWALFCKLHTNLLHYHISKSWMNHPNGLRALVNETLTKYISVYGPCHMTSNFHKLLHCWIDFQNWGPLRSHWAFPYERLYGAIMTGSRHQNRSHVTASIVNQVHLLYLPSDDKIYGPGKLQSSTPENVDLTDSSVSQLLTTDYVWAHTFNLRHSRRWRVMDYLVCLKAGESLNELCFFVIVGILSPRTGLQLPSTTLQQSLSQSLEPQHYFVIRQMLHLRPRRHFKSACTYYTIKTEHLSSRAYIGNQSLLPVTELVHREQAACPVVQYSRDPHEVSFLPCFGLIDFKH